MLGDTDYIALLEQLDEGVIIVSANYNVLYGNKTAIGYFGDKLLDVPIYNLIRNSEVIDARKQISATLEESNSKDFPI